jgi:hypothetical protein
MTRRQSGEARNRSFAKDPSVEDRGIIASHCFRRHAAMNAFHVSDQCGEPLHLAHEVGIGFVVLVEQQHQQSSVCPQGSAAFGSL